MCAAIALATDSAIFARVKERFMITTSLILFVFPLKVIRLLSSSHAVETVPLEGAEG